MAKRFGVMALLVLTSGCYTYTPVRPSDAVLDARVRATVAPQVAAEYAEAFRGAGTQLTGSLVGLDSEGLLLDVPVFAGAPGVSRAAMNNRVRIPLDGLVTLESRTLSKWRTGVAVGSLVAALSATWVVVTDNDVPPDDRYPPGTDNAIRIRIPLGFGFR